MSAPMAHAVLGAGGVGGTIGAVSRTSAIP
jgi:hypothetical protein